MASRHVFCVRMAPTQENHFLRNSNCGECERAGLLKFLGGGVVADQIFKDGQDVLSIADDGLQDGPELGLAHRFTVPLSENRCGDLDVLAQLFGRMATQEQAVKKRGLTLRELEILQRLLQRVCLSRHGRKPQFTDFRAKVKSTRCVRENNPAGYMTTEAGVWRPACRATLEIEYVGLEGKSGFSASSCSEWVYPRGRLEPGSKHSLISCDASRMINANFP